VYIGFYRWGISSSSRAIHALSWRGCHGTISSDMGSSVMLHVEWTALVVGQMSQICWVT